ncbi:radical SAM protein [Desulfovibrio sp. OttesenSCG-928-I05]|nr:radical SAM protein [Desulfovibrio sp. OttesenSCG-928-I05]
MEIPARHILRQGCNSVVENNELLVDWSLIENCNWRCSYCFADRRYVSKFIPSLEQLKCAADNLLAMNKSRYYLYLIGGEITIIPHFVPFIEYLNEIFGDKVELMLVTNGYRPWQYFDNLIALSRNKLNITISIHSEFVKLDRLVSIVENISPKATLSFGLLYHLGKKAYVKEIFSVLSEMKKNYRFGLSIAPVLVPPSYTEADPNYTAEDHTWMKKGNKTCKLLEKISGTEPDSVWPFTLNYDVLEDGVERSLTSAAMTDKLTEGYLNFKDMYCCQGIGYFYLSHTGECRGSRCPINIGPVANFFEPGAQLYQVKKFPVAMKCQLDNCVCAPHHILPKFRDLRETLAFVRNAHKKIAMEHS